MKRTSRFQRHDVAREDRADGSILLRSNRPLGPVARNAGVWLKRWAETAPDRAFLAERSGAGWRELRYGEAFERVRAVAAALLGRGFGPDAPVMILSGNDIEHGVLSLAAQHIGAPVVPLAEQYSLIPAAHGRLIHAAELLRPRLVFASDAERHREALALDALKGAEIIAARNPGGATSFEALEAGDQSADLDTVHAAVGPDTVAKILLTSGSTSTPKAVPTTHLQMCANQAQVLEALPWLADTPPRMLDWLPWNHIFGGSHNFNLALANGGSLYIDDGRPLKGRFERSVENQRMAAGNIAFNVPVGFAMLRDAMREDERLRRRFFEDLDLAFYAGAALAPDVWRDLERMAFEVKGEVPIITSGWGLTETGPAATQQLEPIDRPGIVGAPLAGVMLKLAPLEDGRYEARVKGPNVMSGYLNPPADAPPAFDGEGYFLTGDALSLVDPDEPNKGLKFDGRVAEDFKLVTGTWVRTGAVRQAALDRLAPLAVDVVVTGADREAVGLLIFPDMEALTATRLAGEAEGGALAADALKAEIAARLRAGEGAGSSTRIRQALVLADPPSIEAGEITAKGNLNSRRVLSNRAPLVERLYSEEDAAVVRL